MTSTTAISTTSRGWRYRRSRTSPAGSGTGCTMSCPVSTGFSCAAARAAKAAPSATGRPDPNRRSGYSEPSEQLQHARGGAVGEEVALHATLVGKKIDRQTPIGQQCRQDRVGSLLVEHALGVDHPVSILGGAEQIDKVGISQIPDPRRLGAEHHDKGALALGRAERIPPRPDVAIDRIELCRRRLAGIRQQCRSERTHVELKLIRDGKHLRLIECDKAKRA